MGGGRILHGRLLGRVGLGWLSMGLALDVALVFSLNLGIFPASMR